MTGGTIYTGLPKGEVFILSLPLGSLNHLNTQVFLPIPTPTLLLALLFLIVIELFISLALRLAMERPVI